ncbi:hypothetical protein FRX31_017855 [Thalictrum thalictroides]|uniref:Uncharacterized protein n=1 Tax=Thalictrum thalictroides TaxID=46969 RepID=A0A7J6W6K7_THATH|nr:hypothetical protein FRX31_017855 [Thalictrum thalictroides]
MLMPFSSTTHFFYPNNLVISSKFQRKRQQHPSFRTNDLDYAEEEAEEEFGSIGQIVVESLKSNKHPSRKIEPLVLQTQHKNMEKEIKENQEGTLRGSDVLLALQRATKERNRSRGTGNKGKKKVGRRSRSESGDEDKIDYENVKDLNVKSDWGDRLNELEKQLQQLHRF